MASQDRITAHFQLLESRLREELTSKGFNFSLSNRSLSPTPSLSIEVNLKMSDQSTLEIATVLGTSFPKSAPVLFCKTKCFSEIINPSTLEINYAAFYNWRGVQGRLSELFRAIEAKFAEVPPKKSPSPAETLYRNLANLDLSSAEQAQPNGRAGDLYDEKTVGVALRKCPQVRAVFSQIAELQKPKLESVREILELEATIRARISQAEPAISRLESARSAHSSAVENFGILLQRFKKDAMVRFISRKIEEAKVTSQEIEGRLLAGGLEGGENLELLIKERQNLVALEKLKKIVVSAES